MEVGIISIDKFRAAASILSKHSDPVSPVFSSLHLPGDGTVVALGNGAGVMVIGSDAVEPSEPMTLQLMGRVPKSAKAGVINLTESQIEYSAGETQFAIKDTSYPDWRRILNSWKDREPVLRGSFGLTMSWLSGVLGALSKWPKDSNTTIHFRGEAAFIETGVEGLTILTGLLRSTHDDH